METARGRLGVIVPAAGQGVRMGTKRTKAFLPLSGRPMVFHSLDRLAAARPAEVVLVLAEDILPVAVRRWGRAMRRAGVTAVVPGGPSRQDSVAAGLAALGASCRWVLIHDAARPLVPRRVVEAVVRAARRTGAAVAAVPCADTLKKVCRRPPPLPSISGRRARTGGRGLLCVERTLPRERVWLVQTPQVFRRDLLERAFARWGRRRVTDESGLAEALGVRVAVVPGSPRNLKVTTQEDLRIVRALCGHPPKRRG